MSWFKTTSLEEIISMRKLEYSLVLDTLYGASSFVLGALHSTIHFLSNSIFSLGGCILDFLDYVPKILLDLIEMTNEVYRSQVCLKPYARYLNEKYLA
jgi:hypothetical protein